MKKFFTLLFVMGSMYLNMELVMRALRGELVGWDSHKYVSLAGWTTLWMFLVGGVSGILIGALNENPHKKRPLWLQSLVGMTAIFIIEFSTGCILNIWLDLRLWSYSNWPGNILGQVTILYIPLWYAICPFTIWLDDIVRHIVYGKEKPVSLVQMYKNLFQGK